MNGSMGRAKYRSMLRELATDAVDLHELAVRHRMTRLEMAKWIGKPRHSAMVEAISRLADRRAALLLALGRAEAARALTDMARGGGHGGETARKACLDLLKLVPPPVSGGPRAAARSPEHMPADDEVRATLEHLSRRAEEEAGSGFFDGSQAGDDDVHDPAGAD